MDLLKKSLTVGAALRQGAPPTADAVGRNSAQRGRVSEQIAQMAGVSKDTVKDYHAVQVQGSPQLKEAVDREEVAISDAAQVARHQLPEQQTEALERVRSGEGAAATTR